MRTLWKGAVSFGLVNIPIKMYVATERKDIKFNYLHKECMSPIKYQKYCSNCDKEINNEEIVRGYEYQKGNYVIMNEEDFEKIPLENTKTIDILDFVELNEVDPIYFDKTYYLEPSEGGDKAYSLLVEAMRETSKVAIAKVIIRSKQTLAALRIKDNVLIMETIFYPDEIRSPASLNLGVDKEKLHDNEIKMAVSLIKNLSTNFQPEKYENEHRKALWEVIEAKIVGKEVVAPTPDVEQGNVVDLMEALKASVKLAEENNQEDKKEKTTKKKTKKKAKTGS
ncbi:Ku domain protein [Candidatus Syntrophocurvum alkaliphilum]|uniref:Non-homologous end joining protein Ku n=1 Tax=Candidatus Syntrophocurvum alkaliphilum TaxID=2293317 RepID=A0A6I6DEA5_9FIRM|nr:Ku protein [Candidatus Syntrophocurvum alkaliphilum]QGT98888.1 Ku domain protein [Candidatus Syntrophocurvum alkaliphilum]